MIGIGISPMFQDGAVGNYQPETLAYVSGLTTPLSKGQKAKIDTFVKALKTGLNITALSDVFDVVRILAGETAESSLKNIVKNQHHATAINAPEFTPYEGFTGNGVSSYINSNYILSTSAVRFQLGSACLGAYCRLNIAEDACIMGNLGTSGTVYTDIFPRLINNSFVMRVNSSFQNAAIVNNDSRGMFIANRDNDIITTYKNKVGSSSTIPRTALMDKSVYLLSRGNEFFSTNQIAFSFLGKSLTQVEINVLTDAVEAYMDSNGKGVIG